jgi:hypothetical protein
MKTGAIFITLLLANYALLIDSYSGTPARANQSLFRCRILSSDVVQENPSKLVF